MTVKVVVVAHPLLAGDEECMRKTADIFARRHGIEIASCRVVRDNRMPKLKTCAFTEEDFQRNGEQTINELAV